MREATYRMRHHIIVECNGDHTTAGVLRDKQCKRLRIVCVLGDRHLNIATNVPLPVSTVSKVIEEESCNLNCDLIQLITVSKNFSLQFDESTYVADLSVQIDESTDVDLSVQIDESTDVDLSVQINESTDVDLSVQVDESTDASCCAYYQG
jgi:hypothetical protein